jgi:uncharacterized OB-fold protein
VTPATAAEQWALVAERCRKAGRKVAPGRPYCGRTPRAEGHRFGETAARSE